MILLKLFSEEWYYWRYSFTYSHQRKKYKRQGIPLKPGHSRWELGFYKKGSNVIVSIAECLYCAYWLISIPFIWFFAQYSNTFLLIMHFLFMVLMLVIGVFWFATGIKAERIVKANTVTAKKVIQVEPEKPVYEEKEYTEFWNTTLDNKDK